MAKEDLPTLAHVLCIRVHVSNLAVFLAASVDLGHPLTVNAGLQLVKRSV